jgi:hypothetical protein
MKTNNYDYGQNTINEFNGQVREAGNVFRHFDIETASTNHLSLNQAASSVSAHPDEVLAVMEYRIRHAAQHEK